MNRLDEAHLTRRELQVLALLAKGLLNREIATEIGISTKTYDTHRQHLLKKLKLRNNVELARFAIAAGIVPAPEPVTPAPTAPPLVTEALPVTCDGCKEPVDYPPDIARAVREVGGQVRCDRCGPPPEGALAPTDSPGGGHQCP